jgi:hypothetical protein
LEGFQNEKLRIFRHRRSCFACAVCGLFIFLLLEPANLLVQDNRGDPQKAADPAARFFCWGNWRSVVMDGRQFRIA